MRSVRDIFRSYAEFDSQGRHVNGTDKESNHHYGDAYESLFHDREAVNLMMEVGIADGSSLLAWREVFPNAMCVGLDIHYAARLDTLHSHVEFHLGDQCSRQDCERAAGGRLFDFIVEDTLRTLLFLWPSVRPGGLYIVEEFENIGSLRENLRQLWPGVQIIGTCGPRGEDEPLVVMRKPLC